MGNYKIQMGLFEGPKISGIARPFNPIFEIDCSDQNDALRKLSVFESHISAKLLENMIHRPDKPMTVLLTEQSGYRIIKETV